MKTYDRTTSPELLKSLRSEDSETYEQYLLVALYKDPEFRARCLPLCVRKPVPGGREINLFTYPLHQAIFRVIKGWRETKSDTDMSPAVLRTFLTLMSKQANTVIYEDQVEEAVELFAGIMDAVDVENALYVVDSTWEEWVLERGIEVTTKEFKRGGMEGGAAYIRSLASLQAEINVASGEDGLLVNLDDEWDLAEEDIVRMPLMHSLQAINVCLGGGLGRGEHSVFVAPSGGGKTVMACQIALSMIWAKYNVLFITTEQRTRELLPRIISCWSREAYRRDKSSVLPISIASIGKGISKKLVTSSQWEFIQTKKEVIRTYAQFSDWTRDSLTVEADLHRTVQAAKQHYAKRGAELDVVILDWIGGNLGAAATTPDRRRIMYDEAAVTMKNVAIEYNVSTISMAQATPLATKKRYITQMDIAECKSLHNQAVAGFGIAAYSYGDDQKGGMLFSPDQTLCCFKSRKGITGLANLKRDFTFQRFECPTLRE